MLNTKKASQLNDIPTKYIKKFGDVFTPVITNDYNNCVAIGIFPGCFKTAKVIPSYKKDKPTEKTNYRRISILSNISKIYARLMHDNMSDYFNDVLSKFQCDFRKGFGAQNCLLFMIETIPKTCGIHGVFAAVMTDLSKAFDCTSDELLIAKLNASGFDEISLKVINSYLKNRTQTTKVGSSFSELLNIIFGVPQGSILGPLLFIIYMCDFFVVNKDVNFSSYADDTTPFITGISFENFIPKLESILSDISQWFMNNNLKVNAEKFHLFLSPHEDEMIIVENHVIKSSGVEEFLRVTIDKNLNFKEQILSLCKKANRKLHTLSQVSKYMTLNKGRILMKSFIISQFNYCLLIWMMHNRGYNNKINHIHKRALRIVYNDYSSTFEDLLNKDKSVTIHQHNLQQLAIEIFKVKIGIALKIMIEIFTFVENNTYNLRSGMYLCRVNVHSTQYGTESIGNLGAKIWNLAPVHMKDLKALSTLKNQIKKWIPKDCPCRLRKVYLAQVGLLEKLLRLFASFRGIQNYLFYSFG